MIIELPTHLTMGVRKPKQIPLNLNFYRNADFNQLNNMKIQFDKLVAPRLKDVPLMDRVALTYRLYMPSKRAVDISNVCCIVDKFFCDTLKNAKKIPDDNMEVISSISYHWGGVDKENPRVEVTLMENEPMQITTVVKLDDNDIRQAIEEYVTKEFPTRDHHNLTVDMLYAEGAVSAQVTVGGGAVVAPKPTRGRPRKTETAAPVESAPEAPETDVEVQAAETLSHKALVEASAEAEALSEEPTEEEGTIYPPPEPEGVNHDVPTPIPAPVAQEAAVAPLTSGKSLFPTKTTSSSTPAAKAPEAAPDSKPAGNPKSLFNLKGLGAPKSEATK